VDAERTSPPTAAACDAAFSPAASQLAVFSPAASGPSLFRPVAATARFLLGDWSIAREVRDHRAGRPGSFCGKASFVPEPGGRAGLQLDYRELGELRMGRHRGPASRSLRYRERPDGAADVRFPDGRPFYRRDLRAGCCQAEHRCGADLYLVSVRVLSGDSFTERWRVTGPAKDYEMTSTYLRTGGQE
jgi:uncharacterized protein DUF6314